ncbi:uncharacterized protein LOC144753255 [Lissotriton helveticus]
MLNSTKFITTPHHADIIIGFQTCAKTHPFESHRVIEEYKGYLFAIDLYPYKLLEEITPPVHRDAFNIPTLAAEKHLENMINMMKSTLRLCEFILSTEGEVPA